jgi:gliding motility-associated-like protein
MKKLLLFLFTMLLVCIANTSLFAQGESNIWFFGNQAGLDFNSGSPVVLNTGALSTNEGCASIANSSGVLLFYTDGITVWNSNHVPMPNGNGLFGDPSATQSGVIVPKPGSANQYYIFTCAAQAGNQGICYSQVDMSLNGGLGDVTSLNTQLLGQGCEKITAVKHSNGTDFWVIIHGWSNNSYYAYPVSSAGVGAPVITNIGSVIGTGVSDESIGYLKASPNGLRLAAASSRGVDNCQIFDFNPSTGVLSNCITIPYPSQDGPYGVSFSPNNSVLYVSLEGEQSLYQYDLSSGVEATIIASEYLISIGSYVFALQLAVDNKIYCATFGSYLHVINNPNGLGAACDYVTNAIDLSPGFCTLGLPNFIQSFINPQGITFVNTCLGDSTLFTLSDAASIDSVLWNFNDPSTGALNTSTQLAPSHIFSNVGTYNVSAISYIGSLSDTATAIVNILGLPDFTIGNDTSLCTMSPIVLDPGPGFQSYLWQNASINQTFNVSAFGTYYVSVSNVCGTVTDTIKITQAPIPVVIVNSPTICFGQSATLTATGAVNYSWNNGSTVNPLVVNIDTTTSYSVIGTNSFGCTSSALATVNVNPSPSLPEVDSIVKLCFGDTLMLLTNTVADSYLWNGPNAFTSSLQNPVITNVTENTFGVYTLIITNSSGCASQDSAVVILDCKDQIFIPNVFTPNGDNENQIFKVIASNLKEIEVEIYNRWGIKVYSWNTLQDGWNGKTNNGSDAADGTYYFILNATTSSGTAVSKKGWFSLYR